LINGAEAYETAVKNLSKIESEIASTYRSRKYWSRILNEDESARDVSDDIRKFDQDNINKADKSIYDLGVQYNLAQETVKKYEPIKNEYNKQLEIESKRAKLKTGILNVTGMLILPLAVFALVGWGIILQHKKYKRLIREGKMTQAEYDLMMKNNNSFSSTRTNPATGLTMVGGCDSGGNPAGCFFRSNSTFSDTQDYSDRHRWDR
jgi:hypothetical protein